MATGRIPITEIDGRNAGTVVYVGTVDQGVWSYEPPPRVGDARAEALAERVALAQEANKDLKTFSFVAEGFTMQQGWRGWGGLLRALEYALPAVGLRVDDLAVQHVRPGKPIEGPVDLVE